MRILLDKLGMEILDGFSYIYKRDIFRKKSNYYKFNHSCVICGSSYFTRVCYPSVYCNNKCAMKDPNVRHILSEANKGRTKLKQECVNISVGRSKVKGGVCKNNLPLYDTYAVNLYPIEKVRRNDVDSRLLEVTCSQCGSWFIPTRAQCSNRAQFIKGNIDRESRFYCSDMCKTQCSIFKKKKYPSGLNPRKHRNKISESDLRVWRGEVIKRAKYECEYCGSRATEAHHIQPKKLEPFFALDPDNGIAVCRNCHVKYGHGIDGCGFYQLSVVECG